jgi:geranylgeranyl diphosphate synthase type II
MTDATDFSFTQYAAETRSRVDAALRAYTEFPEGCPESLREAIRYSLLAPGKRLRPVLALLAADTCGGTVEAALPAACAVEMIHAYSLIHDDLPAMDDDDLRRGLPTCHKKFGEALAILAGDALQALAFEVLGRNVQPPAVAAACCAALAQAAGPSQLVGGQADDVEGGWEGGGLEALERLHQRKTGAMIRVALRLGGLTAGAASRQLDALDTYGRHLGLAFQITDDLLDVCGDASQVGKRVGKDSARGKLTFPGLLGFQESRRRAEQVLAEARAALTPLGPRTGGLEAVARYVLERNH